MVRRRISENQAHRWNVLNYCRFLCFETNGTPLRVQKIQISVIQVKDDNYLCTEKLCAYFNFWTGVRFVVNREIPHFRFCSFDKYQDKTLPWKTILICFHYLFCSEETVLLSILRILFIKLASMLSYKCAIFNCLWVL